MAFPFLLNSFVQNYAKKKWPTVNEENEDIFEGFLSMSKWVFFKDWKINRVWNQKQNMHGRNIDIFSCFLVSIYSN